ncbi:auxin-responsive protein IAA18-like isoform X2 [Vigna unguiculata]|uniref:Auxin-induced protein n=1 Tax=Vigna unguiculata TaxID=3917 RepID=A0A4D6ML60_VIGUN|nr:auxin-responsive protein IAA18-like isoform X2 [Vigna unguiculata]QCE02310.1 auxin-responsive protein IAA [Vigna unguiculata]
MWQRSHGSSEERKLELRLGPPSEESFDESIKKYITERNESPLTLGYFSPHEIFTSDKPGPGGVMVPNAWSYQHQAKPNVSSFFQLQSRSQNLLMMRKEVSQQLCCVENKAFSPSYAEATVCTRTVSDPVVGWPPIRSFRKNIASGSSSKLPTGSQQYQHFVPDNVASKQPTYNCGKGLFVKINMDGVPIGRKLNINAYDSYEKLSSGVDELFRGLLAEMKLSHIASSHCFSAQRDFIAGGIQNKGEEEKEKGNTGFLVGSGEYTLVYEDNEGDKMLVGDVPWHMFVSTVKRLRVLKSSDLPAFAFRNKQD